MKYTIICLALLISLVCKASNGDNFEESNLFETMQQGDKAALLIVHFGTTHDLTRKRTIEVINNKMKSAFPDVTIREAYTSRIVINRLKQKKIIRRRAFV
jgi:sirohydrochlorin cobaltochelatase